MLLGTHNSWSYGKTKWPSIFCRCQNLNIIQQYNLGARIFDLRLRRNNKGWGVAHGMAFFDVDLKSDLEFLNDERDCYVRVILEYNNEPSNHYLICEEFKDWCEILEQGYPNIRFFGGISKWDWKTIYGFYNNIELTDKYSSVTSLFKSNNKFLKIIDDWIPILYAKLKNRKNFNEWMEEGDKNLLVDFIQYCFK